MAKFRQGNLVLNTTETIIQGGTTRIDASGAAKFNSLELATGESVTGISGDSTSSDATQLLTASAIQALAGGSGVAGTSGSSGTSGPAGTSGTSSVTAAGTDTAIARYDGSTTIQDSSVLIDDVGNVEIPIDSTNTVYFDLGTITPGTNATLGPDVDNSISLNVGSSTYAWEDINIYAGTSLNFFAADSTSAAIIINSSQVATFKELPVTPSEAPTTDYQVANKKYTDDTALAQVDAGIAAAIGVGVDNTVAIYDGTSSIQDSLVSIDVSGNITGVNDFSSTGNINQADDKHHYIGNGNDLDLYHTGAYGGLDCNTGGLYIDGVSGSDIWFRIDSTLAMKILSDQSVEFSDDIHQVDSNYHYFGTGDDFRIGYTNDITTDSTSEVWVTAVTDVLTNTGIYAVFGYTDYYALFLVNCHKNTVELVAGDTGFWIDGVTFQWSSGLQFFINASHIIQVFALGVKS